MKRETGRMILLTGMLCILSLIVCAYGRTEETPDAEEPRMFRGGPIQGDDIKDDVSTPEPSTEQLETQTTTGTPTEWVGSTPNLEEDVKDLKDGQLTAAESVMEKSDSGGDIMVSPDSEDDSGFNKVTLSRIFNYPRKILKSTGVEGFRRCFLE